MKPLNGCANVVYSSPSPDVVRSEKTNGHCSKDTFMSNGSVKALPLNGFKHHSPLSNGNVPSAPAKEKIANGNAINHANGDCVNKPSTSTSLAVIDEDSKLKQRTRAGESFEECSLWDAFCTYLCYAVLVLVGYLNDLIRPRANKEKNRDGYVPLYASFESFYTRHVYRRVRDCWNMPIGSVPGKYITLLERESKDYGWTFEMTGKKVNCINLGSYNYLGFAENHGVCAEDAIKSVHKYGVGPCSTRREMGNTDLINELDRLVAKFVGTEDAITCAMGFATNSMNIPSILNQGCLVLSDEKNHASIILGLRLSGAKIRVFKHNNMKSLEKRLREAIINGQDRTHLPWEKIIIVVEGVYSMEGSVVRLPEILALKRKYKAYLYLDEAHSIGAMGPHGRGVVDYWGCDPKDVDVMMGTFTKSFGSAGGYIAGSKKLISVLREHSHAHYYGTTMSPPVAQQIITSMKMIMGEDGTDEGIKKIRQLKRNSRYFRQKLKQAGFIVYGNDDSPVIPVALYMPTKIAYVVREMIKRGVATVGVGFPATPLVEGRTRFCVSASHTKEMLDHAFGAICEIGEEITIRVSKLPRRTKEIVYEDSDDDDYDVDELGEETDYEDEGEKDSNGGGNRKLEKDSDDDERKVEKDSDDEEREGEKDSDDDDERKGEIDSDDDEEEPEDSDDDDF